MRPLGSPTGSDLLKHYVFIINRYLGILRPPPIAKRSGGAFFKMKFKTKVLALIAILIVGGIVILSQHDEDWKIGAKIHFEEKSGEDYVGLKEINSFTRNTLKAILNITEDSCADNAKILLVKNQNKIAINHYTEKMNPMFGEEMHSTLIYTSPRGFCNSETLKQVCNVLFSDCTHPISIEKVATRYESIIKSDWRLKISKIVVHKNKGNTTFSAQLLFEDKPHIYFNEQPISASLHLTLIQCFDNSVLNDATMLQLLELLNQQLQGKLIKIAPKNGMADLEFGLSGQAWRLRAGKKIYFNKL